MLWAWRERILARAIVRLCKELLRLSIRRCSVESCRETTKSDRGHVSGERRLCCRVIGICDAFHVEIENRVVGGRAEVHGTVRVKRSAVLDPPTSWIFHKLIVIVFAKHNLVLSAVVVELRWLFDRRLIVERHGVIGHEVWLDAIKDIRRYLEMRFVIEKHSVVKVGVLLKSIIEELRWTYDMRLIVQEHGSVDLLNGVIGRYELRSVR
jgi:hypothetical protein